MSAFRPLDRVVAVNGRRRTIVSRSCLVP